VPLGVELGLTLGLALGCTLGELLEGCWVEGISTGQALGVEEAPHWDWLGAALGESLEQY
jgi:hypothetical protein